MSNADNIRRLRSTYPKDSIIDGAIDAFDGPTGATDEQCEVIAQYLKKEIQYGKGMARNIARKELENLEKLTDRKY
jgi:hypothetical protein